MSIHLLFCSLLILTLEINLNIANIWQTSDNFFPIYYIYGEPKHHCITLQPFVTELNQASYSFNATLNLYLRLKVAGLHIHDNPCIAEDSFLLSVTFVLFHKNCSERITGPKVGSLLSQSDQFFSFWLLMEKMWIYNTLMIMSDLSSQVSRNCYFIV